MAVTLTTTSSSLLSRYGAALNVAKLIEHFLSVITLGELPSHSVD